MLCLSGKIFDLRGNELLQLLTLKTLSKFVADDIQFFFYCYFLNTKDLTFHVNCLPCRQSIWNAMSYFLWKTIKKFRMSSVAILLSTVRLKCSNVFHSQALLQDCHICSSTRRMVLYNNIYEQCRLGPISAFRHKNSFWNALYWDIALINNPCLAE